MGDWALWPAHASRAVPLLHRSIVTILLAGGLWLAVLAPVAGAAEDVTTHTVYAGQTLGKIARRYRVSIEDLCRVNNIPRGVRLKPGQKLVIPDEHFHEPSVVAAKASNKWQDYVAKPRRKGFVVLDTPTKHWKGFVLAARGRILPKAQEGIEKTFASWRTGQRHPIEPRLIRLLVTISDNFGGRPIRVVSGYRERSYAVESKHKVGRALDFSIPGIPNAAVRDYLRTLTDVGVGYYPNSTHVHVDVREAAAYWVDTAKPGEPPKYARHGTPEEPAEVNEAANPGDGDESEVWSAGSEDAPAAPDSAAK